MPLQLGSFVILQGLEKAPVYNGITGLIVEAKNEQGRYGVQLLDHAKGWNETASSPKAKFAVGGKTIAVKEENLKKTTRDSKYWRIAGARDTSILERVRMDPKLANLDRSDELARGIWNCFFETVPGVPLMIDEGARFRNEIVSKKGHTVYWFALDAIQRHMIIEKCRGRYRVFQSVVDEAPVVPGYTAKQWCSMDSSKRLLSTSVHKTFGGGRTVGDAEINQLLDSIKDLQNATETILPHLLQNIPGLDQSAIDLIKKGPTRLSNEEIELAQEKMQLAVTWSNVIENLIGPLGLTTLNVVFNPENVQVLGDAALIVQGVKKVFEIPEAFYLQVQQLSYKLTGQTILSPVTFLRMINTGMWWEHRRDIDGGGVAFTVRLALLDLVQTYEEGLALAREKKTLIQSCLS